MGVFGALGQAWATALGERMWRYFWAQGLRGDWKGGSLVWPSREEETARPFFVSFAGEAWSASREDPSWVPSLPHAVRRKMRVSDEVRVDAEPRAQKEGVRHSGVPGFACRLLSAISSHVSQRVSGSQNPEALQPPGLGVS